MGRTATGFSKSTNRSQPTNRISARSASRRIRGKIRRQYSTGTITKFSFAMLVSNRKDSRETRTTAKLGTARNAIKLSILPFFLSNALRKVPPSQTRKTISALFQSTSQF
jgi:hypothetical protein